MSTFGRVLAPGAMLALAIGLAISGSSARGYGDDDDKAIKAAQKDVLDLATEIADGKSKEVAAKAGVIRKKYEELNTVMQGYKPSTKKGIGTKIGTPGSGDGIELKLINMGKGRGTDALALKKDREALIRVGYINIAIAEITHHYPPTKKIANGPAKWKQMTEEMKKASHEFIEAVKAGSPEKTKKAAENVNNSCNTCHAEFRDS